MPTPKQTCEFCGAELKPREMKFAGQKLTFYESCTCEQALEHERQIEAEREAAERRKQRELLEGRYKRAGVPRRYWDAETDDPRFEGWCETVKDGGGLFFTGAQGRGKTHAACAILCRWIAANRRVYFADIEGIEREVTAAWRSHETSEDAVIWKYTNAELVVIDDLGAEELTTVTMKVLRAVISGREANLKPTIFTSNFSRLDFAKHLAQEADKVMAARLASRISGMTEVHEFTGADRRLGG